MNHVDKMRLASIRKGIADRIHVKGQQERADEFLVRLLDEALHYAEALGAALTASEADLAALAAPCQIDGCRYKDLDT